MILRLSKGDYDGEKGRPRGTRGKRHIGREEQGQEKWRRNCQKAALVVNSEADKVGREGDRGRGREKYGCAEGNRNE